MILKMLLLMDKDLWTKIKQKQYRTAKDHLLETKQVTISASFLVNVSKI